MWTRTQRYYIILLFDRNVFSSEGCMVFSQINKSWTIVKKHYVTVAIVMCTIVSNSSASSAIVKWVLGLSTNFLFKTHFKLNSHGFSCEEETLYGTCISISTDGWIIIYETKFKIYIVLFTIHVLLWCFIES